MHQLRRTGSQLVEVFAVERIDEINLFALEAQHLDIPVRLNVELDRIQIGQLAPVLVFFPVIGISLQQDRCPWLVIGDHERAQYGHLLIG